MGQHLQQHIHAAAVIAVADEIRHAGPVHAVSGIHKQVDKGILPGHIIPVGDSHRIVLQIDHADGTFILHGTGRVDGIAHPVENIQQEFLAGSKVPGVAVRADQVSGGQTLSHQNICQIVNDKGVGHVGEIDKILFHVGLLQTGQISLVYMELNQVFSQQFQVYHFGVCGIGGNLPDMGGNFCVSRRIQFLHILLGGVINDLGIVGINRA